MYLALFALTSPSSAGRISNLDKAAALAFAEKLELCAETFAWEHCLEALPDKRFGSTGRERVGEWMEGREIVLAPDDEGVSVTERGVEVGYVEMRGVWRYAIEDVTEDGLEDLIVMSDDHRIVVLPQAREAVGRRE